MSKTRILVLASLLLCVLGILTSDRTAFQTKEGRKEKTQVTTEEAPKYQYPHYNQKIAYYTNWYKPTHIQHETITHVEMNLTSLGWYYITSYCPSECGYNGSNYPTGWTTASGTICHRSDQDNRITEPTTCAIDRNLHSFGDLFYIPDFDRVFIAEDTGSAVKGKHLDLFYEDFYDVQGFPTGWYEVYAVEYIYTEEEVEYYDFDKVRGIQSIVWKEYKHDTRRSDT